MKNFDGGSEIKVSVDIFPRTDGSNDINPVLSSHVECYDEFMFEDKEVSEDEWISLTSGYLSNSSDFIIWNEL
jgi:hypothetical protein